MQTKDIYAQSPLLSTIRQLKFSISPQECLYLANQLRIAIRDYYVHLPIKKSAFAIDPIQQLDLLVAKPLNNINPTDFLFEILFIINGLKDRHTTITLPPPWKNIVAYLPFVVEEFFLNGHRLYTITKKLYGVEVDDLVVGSIITHWNGVPMDVHVDNIARQTQGANQDASRRLALAEVTIRGLEYALIPDEDWATLSLITPDKKLTTVSLPWKYYVNMPKTEASSTNAGMAQPVLGVDHRLSMINTAKNSLFTIRKLQKPKLKLDGNILKYGTINTTSGEVGYIRIYSFEVGNVDQFITKIIKILKSLPKDKLIIDIRNNPGGMIPAGQLLVQLLSKKTVSSSPVSFRNTLATKFFSNETMFNQWAYSLNVLEQTGQTFSQHFSLTDYSKLSDYRYPGKSAVIIDALVYSTSDFFTADFKDNNVGTVVGVDAQTGGGGANVWPYNTLVQFAAKAGPSLLGALPRGIGLNISMRRSIRTGAKMGIPVEDLGTTADFIHRITHNDLLNEDEDLLNFTASKL